MNTLTNEDRRQVVIYRLEKAEKTYDAALKIIQLNFVETAANRLYYSAYYAVGGLLLAYGITTRTHNGIKSMFSLHFIKTKVIDSRYASIYSRLLSLRMTGDYEDRRNLDMETDVKPLVEPTRELIELVSKLAKKKIEII